jgi:hypothetical protein
MNVKCPASYVTSLNPPGFFPMCLREEHRLPGQEQRLSADKSPLKGHCGCSNHWTEVEYWLRICSATGGSHIEPCQKKSLTVFFCNDANRTSVSEHISRCVFFFLHTYCPYILYERCQVFDSPSTLLVIYPFIHIVHR